MKKISKILISFSICIVIVLTLTYTKFFVKAENGNGIIENLNPKKCNVVTADDKYNPYVFVPKSFNDTYYTVSIDSGVFDVYIYQIKVNDQGKTYPELKNTITLNSKLGQKSAKINYTRENEPTHYEVVFVLKESDNLCSYVEGSTPVRNNEDGSWGLSNWSNPEWGAGEKLGYIYYHQVDVAANAGNAKINNVHYNGICAALRNGNYDSFASQFEKAGLSKEDFQKYYAEATNRLSYCTSKQVESNMKESEVAMLIRNAIASIKMGSSGTTGSLEGPPEGEVINIGDGSTDLSSQPLVCPSYDAENKPNKSYTQKQYYKKEITTKNLDIYTTIAGNDAQCKKTCEETVKVTYGPPVATKAGLCFEYKVKVESKLNCMTEFIGEEPKPEDYKVCTPVGSCNGGALRSASGPNNDFDSCVNSCDGGKYTQSCINSCYEKVYGQKPVLPVNYNNKLSSEKVEQLATKEELERYYDILESKNDIGPGKKYSYEDLQLAVVEAGSGYYYVQNGSIAWKMGTRYWDKPGRYYTVNITSYTVNRLKSAGRWNPTWQQDGLSVVDKGFLRNNYGSSVCMASCNWSGCDAARQNGYYKGYPNNPGTATNREFLNYGDATIVYKEEFERYENAVKECKAAATCTSQTSEFTIQVNNKIKDDEDNIIKYETEINESGNLQNANVNGKPLSDTTIILDRSGCYNPETSNGHAIYMTEWSFPGTWINNKTGKISYQPVTGNAWHLKKEKFCTNLDSVYVNTDWWTHRILHSNTSYSDEEKATIEDYNILATAREFGYFKWDFDIKCYYSLYDSIDQPGDGGNGGDNNKSLKPLSYKIRSIELKDMFPNNDNESATENPNETGRNQGYNWTDGASNVKNKDYEVTPGALYPVIQSRGNEIYDADKNEQYLDYEFYLTPADLNKIRKYSEHDGDNKFSSFPGKINIINGIAYYESALFRASSASSYKLNSDSIITLGTLGVNNQKKKGSNEAEVFTNSYTSALLQSREEYLNSIAGGNKNE